MKEKIADLINKQADLPRDQIIPLIEIPKDPKLGDYAFPCFALAKILKKSPVQIALELAVAIDGGIAFEKIEASGPYLNFHINRKSLAEKVIKDILTQKDKYGSSKIHERAIIEFPSPNTNKPLHIGHARNIVLGQSIASILRFMGNQVSLVNLNNDRGVHICKSMLAYARFGKGDNPKKSNKKSDHFVGDYYVIFAKELQKNPELEKSAQEYLQRWENGDKKIISLWKKMNKWAIGGFKETYKKFNLKFDREYHESEIYKSGKEIIQEGLKKGIFKQKPDGAVYADLNKFNLGEKILLRADGTSIYVTQDIYLAHLKQKDFNANKSIIVSANEQLHHFKVLFKILEVLGNDWAKKSSHLNYGMVNLESGRMKSREGNVVDSDDLISELTSLALDELNKRYPQLSNNDKENRAKTIAMAALRYYYLKIDRARDVTFKPEESISFEGDTGPYLLYTYARARNILRKAKYKRSAKISAKSLDDTEKNLIFQLSQFPEVVKSAYEQYAPNLIANYAFQIAQMFNEFYHKNQVIGSENEKIRLALVDSFSQILKNSLHLLGIPVLEKM